MIYLRGELIRAKPSLEPTYTRLPQASHIEFDLSVARKWSLVGSHILDNDLLVVVEFLRRTRDHMTTINRHLQVVKVGVVTVEKGVPLDVEQGWGVANHKLVAHDRRIPRHSLIKVAQGFVASKVCETGTVDLDLRKARFWSARRLDVKDLRDVIVQELYRC